MKFRKQTKINGYHLIELLGEGLTSCVYKAIKRHRSWDIEQTVALKILKSKDLVPTFAQEVKALARVDSPHCVKFYDWIEGQKTPILVLEYLDGMTLDECMRSMRFSAAMSDEIIAQVQIGLRDLHKKNLKHGDLSPKNIFITKQGIVKLLDFGLSLQKDSQLGTLAYLSPEGWRQQEQTAASDLYSLGIIQYEMQSGDRIYHRDGARERCDLLRDKNSLLQVDEASRNFLSLESQHHVREELAKKITYLKETCRYSVQTTTLVEKVQTVRTKLFPRWTAAIVTAFVFMYSHHLHPSSLVERESSLLRLEVRSFRWAEVQLFQKRKNRMVLIAKQYTPFLHKELLPGYYQIHWSMPPQNGSISVHLNKNRRILLP